HWSTGLLAEVAAVVSWSQPPGGRPVRDPEMARGSRSLALALGRRRPEILRRIGMLRRNTSSLPASRGSRAALMAGLLAGAASIACAGVGPLPSTGAQEIRLEGQPGAPAPKPAAKDLHGGPLPPGALARLGTVRFRCPATAVAYSPDGKVLAVGGGDNQIRLLNAATGQEIRRLCGHQTRTWSPPRDNTNPLDVLVGSV